MKKVFLMTILLALSTSLARGETITLVSYYPAPQGAFQEIFLVPETTNLAEPCVVGTLYFNDSGQFMICQDDGTGNGLWEFDLLWARDGDNVYTLDVEDKSGDFWSVGIGTQSPEFRLTLENDGSILAKGSYGTGKVLATSGAGTRLIWYPRKAAFRAGRVDGTQWNDGNIGEYTFAAGFNPIASGHYATALGYKTIAKGAYSLSMGAGGTLTGGDYSTYMGVNNKASGVASTALGSRVDVTGNYSTGIGFDVEASGDYATVFGFDTETGKYATAMGYQSHANGDYSSAFGNLTVANGLGATTFGRWTRGEGIGSTAMGINGKAWSDYSVALGYQSWANSEKSIVMGYRTTANGESSLSKGNNANSSGDMSVSMGSYITAAPFASFVFGEYNLVIAGTNNAWVETDPLFTVGNGIDDLNRLNAITVLKNGKVGIGTDSPRSVLNVQGLDEYSDNTAALTGGLTQGAVYRTGDVLKIVH